MLMRTMASALHGSSATIGEHCKALCSIPVETCYINAVHLPFNNYRMCFKMLFKLWMRVCVYHDQFEQFYYCTLAWESPQHIPFTILEMSK